MYLANKLWSICEKAFYLRFCLHCFIYFSLIVTLPTTTVSIFYNHMRFTTPRSQPLSQSPYSMFIAMVTDLTSAITMIVLPVL